MQEKTYLVSQDMKGSSKSTQCSLTLWFHNPSPFPTNCVNEASSIQCTLSSHVTLYPLTSASFQLRKYTERLECKERQEPSEVFVSHSEKASLVIAITSVASSCRTSFVRFMRRLTLFANIGI